MVVSPQVYELTIYPIRRMTAGGIGPCVVTQALPGYPTSRGPIQAGVPIAVGL
jgi:hypothetical protein